MLKVKVTARCSASIEKTFIALTDFKTMKAANPELEKITHTHGELGVYSDGVRFRKSIISGGRIYDEDVEVIECSPPDSYTERAFSMGVEYKSRARLLSLGHQTEVKVEYDFSFFELKTKMNLPLQATAIKQKMHTQWLQMMRTIDPSVSPKSITVELKIYGQSPAMYWAGAAATVSAAVIMAVGLVANDNTLDPIQMPARSSIAAVDAGPEPVEHGAAQSAAQSATASAASSQAQAQAQSTGTSVVATAKKSKQPAPRAVSESQQESVEPREEESGLPDTVVDANEVKPIRAAAKRASREIASESGADATENIINDTLSTDIQADALSEE